MDRLRVEEGTAAYQQRYTVLYILDDITLCDVFSTHWDDPSFLRERFYSFIIPMVNCFCDRMDNLFVKVDSKRKL